MNPNRMTKRGRLVLIGAWLLLFAAYGMGWAEPSTILEAGAFSKEEAGHGLPARWEPLHFKSINRHTRYRLVQTAGQVVVQAEADASASGLMRKITIDPGEYPIVQWRWKIAGVSKNGTLQGKDGDDYPARLYILFGHDSNKPGFFETLKYETAKLFYGPHLPMTSINYIWAPNASEGLMVPSPYSDRSMMVVVESGERKVNQWVTEERNIREDYRKAFNEEPPMISGVAIMTDTDNTGGSATAWYGDILFLKRPTESVPGKPDRP
jgi:hypothetical protein